MKLASITDEMPAYPTGVNGGRPPQRRRVKQSVDPNELLNLANDAIIASGMDHRIDFWNAAAVAMYGWSVQEALGKNVDDLLKTKFAESGNSVRILLESGTWQGELIHYAKDGRALTVRTKHVLRRGDDGIPSHFVQVNTDITQRKVMEQELEASQARLEQTIQQRMAALRYLSSHLMRVQDEERRRIARELHDSLGQYLTDAKIKLDSLVCSVLPDQAEILAGAQQSVEHSLTETRTISYLLHPPLLDEAGLMSAVRWYLEGFAQRSGIETRFELPNEADRLPDGIELALFRILQESLTNVHRHSGSSRVEVEFIREKDCVTLAVRDFGHGMTPEALERFHRNGNYSGVGLSGMRERANDLGGHLEIQSSGNGTVVSVSIPLPVAESGVAA
jgi:PAS domain S-box-containing protein